MTEMYVTEKANGAYAACQVFKGPDGEALLFVSSKATPLLFKIPEGDSVKEKKQFLLKELKSRVGALEPLLVFIATESIEQLSQCPEVGKDLFNPDDPFWQGGMCVGEAEQGDHIIPLTGRPTIRWFKRTGLDASVSIESELKGLEEVGLRTVKHYSISAKELAEKEKEWRGSKDIEGVVVYYKVDGKVNQIKYKAIPYIILRALREFLNGKRGKQCLSFLWQQGNAVAVLSSANRPKHVAQVIDDFLEAHPHLLALGKNAEFGPIVQENIKEYKRDFPRFIQFLLDSGYSERDLGYESGYGIGQLYQEFKERKVQAEEDSMTKIAESLPAPQYFQGLIIALSGPPGVGKDAVAKELARHDYWKNTPHGYWQDTPLVLSKDLATEELRKKSSYTNCSEKQKTQQRFTWLTKEIRQAVQEKRPIITTTCNGSPQELAWITEAAQLHNLAVVLVYPEVPRKEDMTTFSAALIVSVLRRQDHATLSASTGKAGNLNSEFAQVVKRRMNGDLYTHALADGYSRIPASDFYDKYLPTELLSYFKPFSFDTFLTQTDLSEEPAKVQSALGEVVVFLDGEKQEISTDSLTVLRGANELEIENIFQRHSANKLSADLIEKIRQLEKRIVYQQERTLEDKANYYGVFLDPKSSAETLKSEVIKALNKDPKLPDWLKTYVIDEAAEPDAKQLKKDKKKGADRCTLHLTLAHANLLHQLSLEAFTMLKKMVLENSGKAAEITLKVKEICYNKGVIYASNVCVLRQMEDGNFKDVTTLLVASGMPHITLATRKEINPVYALHAEQARKAGGARAQGIKTLHLDSPLTLVGAVSTDLQNTRIYDQVEKRGSAVQGKSTDVRRQQKAKIFKGGKDGHVNEHRGYASPAFFSSTKGESPTSAQARAAACTTGDQVAVPSGRLH